MQWLWMCGYVRGFLNAQDYSNCIAMILWDDISWVHPSNNDIQQSTIDEKWKCVIFKCYFSEKLITLNILHEVVPTWYSFHSWVDWSNAAKSFLLKETTYCCRGSNRLPLYPKPTFLPTDQYAQGETKADKSVVLAVSVWNPQKDTRWRCSMWHIQAMV